jgi:hypothetical protein
MLSYKRTRFWIIIFSIIITIVIGIGLKAIAINTTKISDVVEFTLNPLDRVTYGTLIFENEVLDLDDAKAEEVSDYLRGIKVSKSPISKNRDINRGNINQVHFIYRGVLGSGETGNIYFNFNKDFSIVWVDNDIKPSLSYHVKEPAKIKDFFKHQLTSVAPAPMEIDFDIEKSLENIMSSPKESSNPQEYINAHKDEYENIFKYDGEGALQYMLDQFEKGNAEDLRGQIMMILCKELLGAKNNVTDESLSPQEWYEALDIHQEITLPDYEYDGEDKIEKLVYDAEIGMVSSSNKSGGFIIVAPKIFGSYEEENMLKIFVTTYSARYKLYGNTLSEEGGSIVPAAITYRKDDNDSYILDTYEQARDGSEFGPSIKKYCRMPRSNKEIKGLVDKILNHYGDYEDILVLMNDNLFKHLKKNGITDATLTNSQGGVIFSTNELKYRP